MRMMLGDAASVGCGDKARPESRETSSTSTMIAVGIEERPGTTPPYPMAATDVLVAPTFLRSFIGLPSIRSDQPLIWLCCPGTHAEPTSYPWAALNHYPDSMA